MYAPKIFPDLSRKRVLTMEWVVGESPTDLLSLSTSSAYSERQKLEAKRRLLDLVCDNNDFIFASFICPLFCAL